MKPGRAINVASIILAIALYSASVSLVFATDLTPALQNQWSRSTKSLRQLLAEGYEIKGVALQPLGDRGVQIVVVQKGSSAFTCADAVMIAGGRIAPTCAELIEAPK